jgi:MtfA peptidase
MNWLARALLPAWLQRPNPKLPQPLWQNTLASYPFLQALSDADKTRLHDLCALFLQQKEFQGVGIAITDAMALDIAAQACLPLLHLHERPAQALHWYDDFVGIVVHPGQMRARRTLEDETGVVHSYSEDLVGEALDGGPVTLSWADVQAAATESAQGYNVVIHEFAHKLDLRDGQADGCPPLPSSAARAQWQATLQAEYQSFCDALALHQRFAAPEPFLDPYACESVDEFFAVAAESYFVNRPALQAAHPGLPALFDSFFRPKLGM